MKKICFCLTALLFAALTIHAENIQVNISIADYKNVIGDCKIAKENFLFNAIAGSGNNPSFNADGSLRVHNGNMMSFVVGNDSTARLVSIVMTVSTATEENCQYVWKAGSEFSTTNAVVVNMADMNIHKIVASYTGNVDQTLESSGIEKYVQHDYDVPKDTHGIYTLSGIKLSTDRSNLTPGIYIIDGKKTIVK